MGGAPVEPQVAWHAGSSSGCTSTPAGLAPLAHFGGETEAQQTLMTPMSPGLSQSPACCPRDAPVLQRCGLGPGRQGNFCAPTEFGSLAPRILACPPLWLPTQKLLESPTLRAPTEALPSFPGSSTPPSSVGSRGCLGVGAGPAQHSLYPVSVSLMCCVMLVWPPTLSDRPMLCVQNGLRTSTSAGICRITGGKLQSTW